MEPPIPPPSVRLEPDELLAHAPWVRRLARALVHDDETAQDVAQQTWLAALTHPPRRDDPIRGWLRTIARNVVRKFGRDDEARRRREAAAASREALPPVDDAVARAELHARVVAVVLALDEPYKSTLIRRYFDELSPTEIARRDGMPLETVRTRLKRGLELVRGRIVPGVSDAGDRRELAQALAPLLQIAGAGVTIVATTVWKLAGVAAIVVALALVGIYVAAPRLRSHEEPKVGALPAAAAAGAAAGEKKEDPVRGSAEVMRTPEPTRTDAARARVLLQGFIVDTTGAQVQDATIAWVAGGVGDAATRAWSSADQIAYSGGQYAIEGLPGGLVTFRIEATGCQPLDATLDLGASTAGAGVVRHDFVLPRSIVVPVKIVTSEGKPFFTAGRAERPSSLTAFNLAIVVRDRLLPPVPPLTNSFLDVIDPAGRAYITGGGRAVAFHGPPIPDGADGVIEAARLPVTASLLFANVVLASQPVTTADAPVIFTIDPATIDARLGRITATCVDAESGEPLKGARFSAGTDNVGGGERTTGDDGVVAIGPIAPGWVVLHVSATGRETWHGHVLVKPGETTDLGDLELERSIEVTGKVTDRAAKPVEANFGILCLDRYVRGRPFYTHNYEGFSERGKLSLPGLGRHRYVVATMPGRGQPDAAIFVVDLTSGVAPPLDVKLLPATFVHIAPHTAPDERLFAELRTGSGDLVTAHDVFARREMYETLPVGGYVVSIFDGDRLLRSVPFEAVGASLLVEFDAHDDGPATISSIDPSQQRRGLLGAPTATPAAAPSIVLKDVPGLVLSGTLKDRTGAPIAGGTITATGGAGRPLRTSTTSNGSFAFAGLSPGRLDVTASADACIDATESVELGAAEPRHWLDFALDRATRMNLTFTDLDGAPLATRLLMTHSPIRIHTISVVATREDPGRVAPPKELVVSRWLPGYPPFGEPDAGKLDVNAPFPVYVSAVVGQRVVATRKLDAPLEELELAIDPKRLVPAETSLRFRLVDARTAEPIVTAFAAVTQLSAMAGGEPRTLPPEAGGVWTLEHLAPGRQLLCVTLAAQANLTFVVDLTEGQVNDLGDLQVLRGVELEGVAVDEQGNPSTEKLRVISQGVDGEPQFDGGYVSVEPDRDGHFKLRASTPFLRLQPSSRDYAVDPLIFDARLAPANGLRYVVKHGVAVTLRAKLEGGATRRVRLRRSDGVLLRDLTLRGSTPEQIRLVPGSYRAVMDGEGTGAAAEKNFTVADAPVDVDVGS
jgi:RNA polymerase sigma factor (sigma-70 family)